MKKLLFLLTVGATAALTSCSNDVDIAVNEGTPITFATPVVSRATETTTANINCIYVTAKDETKNDYFKNLNFTGNNNSDFGYFTSTTKYYWPGDGTSLFFWASNFNHSDWTISKAENASKYSMSKSSITISDMNTEDHVVAYNEGSNENEDEGVRLHFAHLYSQIVVVAQNSNANSGYNYKFAGAVIGNVNHIGDVTVSASDNSLEDNHTGHFSTDASKKPSIFNVTPKWETKESYTFSNKLTEIKEIKAKQTNNGIVLLGEYSNNSYKNGAMMLPQKLATPLAKSTEATTSDEDDNKEVAPTATISNNGGSYIGVLLNLTTDDGALVYPKKLNGKEEPGFIAGDDANATNFAYAVCPIGGKVKDGEDEKEFEWENGKRYIYILDFNGGAGLNPDGPVEILGKEIKFTVCVEDWTDGSIEEYKWDSNEKSWNKVTPTSAD